MSLLQEQAIEIIHNLSDENIVYLIDFMKRFMLPKNVDLQADRKTDASDHADFMHEMEKMRIKAKSYFSTGFDSQTIWEEGGVILQTARIYSLALIYAFGGRSAVGAYAENAIGVQYRI